MFFADPIHRLMNGGGKAFLLSRSRKALGKGGVAARGFHEQHVRRFFRKNGAAHQRLVIKIDVAGVKKCSSLPAKGDSGRSENMAGIVKFKRGLILIFRLFARNAFAIE